MQRFELVEGTSNKFWEVWTDGTEVHTRYGRIGAAGQETVKVTETEKEAGELAAKLIREKTGKGYKPVKGKSAPAKTTGKPAGAKGTVAAKAPAAKSTPAAASTDTAIKPFPLAFDVTLADANHGVLAIFDGNCDLIVARPGQDRQKVVLQSASGLFKRYPQEQLNGLKVVRHAGEACLAASWNAAADGPGLGLFRLDGSPIAIRYVQSEATRRSNFAANARGDLDALSTANDHTKLLAVTPSGDALAWQHGYTLNLIATADFVAGKKPTVYKAEPRSAAFDEQGLLYAPRPYNPDETGWYDTFAVAKKEQKIVKGPGTAARLCAYDGGLINGQVVISGGKLRPLKTQPWLTAIGAGKGDFECHTAAGTGDVVCLGPGATRQAHLLFVQPSTGKLLGTKKDIGRSGRDVYLMDGTLYAIGGKKFDAFPWPADGVPKAR